MKHSLYLLTIIVFAGLISCSRDNEGPSSPCAEPESDLYAVGQIDTLCVVADEGDQWFNFPETVSRFECGRLLKSDFINYEDRITESILLSIPHVNGDDCAALSPNAIQIGRYSFLQDEFPSEPGKAGFSITIDRKLYASWVAGLEQDADAYIEVLDVQDVEPKPSWSYATQYKKVSGKINCSIQAVQTNEEPIKVSNLQFSMYMIY